MENGRIKSVEPTDALLHYVGYNFGNDPTRFGVLCESTFLFDRRECLETWRETYAGPAGKVVTPRDFSADVSKTKRVWTL